MLNPHHALEYVLAYNNGRVYYFFHWSFGKDFQRIAQQWADSKGVPLNPQYQELTDEFYPHILPADDVAPPTPHSTPVSDSKPRLPRDDDSKYTQDQQIPGNYMPLAASGEMGYTPGPIPRHLTRSETEAI